MTTPIRLATIAVAATLTIAACGTNLDSEPVRRTEPASEDFEVADYLTVDEFADLSLDQLDRASLNDLCEGLDLIGEDFISDLMYDMLPAIDGYTQTELVNAALQSLKDRC